MENTTQQTAAKMEAAAEQHQSDGESQSTYTPRVNRSGRAADQEGLLTNIKSNQGYIWLKENKKSISLGAIILTAVVGFIILDVIFLHKHEAGTRSCALEKLNPGVGSPRIVHILKPFPVKAKLAGYIYVNNTGYLPLTIERMSMNSKQDTLTFEDDCIKLSLHQFNQNTANATIKDIGWTFVGFPEEPGQPHKEQPYEICLTTVNSEGKPFNHTFRTKNRYSCQKIETYGCRKPDQNGTIETVAELVIESFDFELKGNPAKADSDDFTKTPDPNSCI